jgi:pilus assembly protein FimV
MRISTAKLFVLGVLGVAMLLFPADGLRALGLGEARVDSYLGQPLDVTIRLVEADASALESLTVAQATSRDHERLGVPADALALGLDVTVDRRVDPPLVRVRSRRAVNDPVIQFLVDARWSGGRLLREYTLFLDPPTVEVAPPVRRTEPEPSARPAEPTRPAEPAPRAETRPRAPAPDPTPRETPAPTPEPSPEPRGVAGETIGPIGAGQTLWSVAYGWRPDTSLTMNQVMLAIFERNPDAFMGGNVNRLRRGAELTMPELDDVRAVSAAEADRRIRDQMQAWQQGTTQREVPVVAEAAVPEVEAAVPPTEPAPAPSEAPDVVHRLEVVPPESDTFDEGPAVSEGEVRRVSSRLRELEDQMWDEGLERDDLLRQIDNIREAIEIREAAGLAVADEELAVLEDRLRAAREARAAERDAVAELADDEVDVFFRELGDELGLDEEDPAEVAMADEEVATETESEPVAVSEPEAAPAPVSEAGDRGLPFWLWPLLALVVIAALVAVFVLRRRASAPAAVNVRERHDVKAERARVAAEPKNLAAHLALLEALGAREDSEGFANALDDMYRQVDNDEDPHWQDALNLAVVHAPNHPLLTPNETPLADDVDDEEGLDDRTREMLGILGADSRSESDDDKDSSPDDYELGSDLGTEEEERLFETSDDDFTKLESEDASDDEIPEGSDFDLAVISDRLDEVSEVDDEEPIDLPDEGELEELIRDEDDEPAAKGSETAVKPEPGDADSEEDDRLNLDFSFGQPAGDAEVEPEGAEDDSKESEQEADAEPAEPEFDPDREFEAFLRPEQAAADDAGDAEPEGEEEDQDRGEPTPQRRGCRGQARPGPCLPVDGRSRFGPHAA